MVRREGAWPIRSTVRGAYVAQQEDLLAALIEFSDTLVDDHDVVEFLHRLARRCVESVGASEVGVMLADRDGTLERVRVVERPDSVSSNLISFATIKDRAWTATEPGSRRHRRLANDAHNWPRFGPRAREAGFESVSVLPLRRRSDVIGVLALFSSYPDLLEANGRMAAQALADIATIGMLQAGAFPRRADGHLSTRECSHLSRPHRTSKGRCGRALRHHNGRRVQADPGLHPLARLFPRPDLERHPPRRRAASRAWSNCFADDMNGSIALEKPPSAR